MQAAAALLLVALAAGCGGSSGPSAAEIVSQTVEKTGAVRSFHLIIDVGHVPARSGLSLTFVDGDVAVPDRLKGRIGGTFLGLPISSDLVVVGEQYFLKVPFTGKWRTIEVATLPAAFFDPAKGLLAVIEDATGLARDGSEDVGGIACYRLEGKVRADALTPLLNNARSARLLPIELWIGKDDLLLRRLRLIGPVSPDEGDDAVRTVELSAFDEPVSISAPVS